VKRKSYFGGFRGFLVGLGAISAMLFALGYRESHNAVLGIASLGMLAIFYVGMFWPRGKS